MIGVKVKLLAFHCDPAANPVDPLTASNNRETIGVRERGSVHVYTR